jgi:hypothetical protein
MDEREMEQEGQNGKRKGWVIERNMFFFCGIAIFILAPTVIRNPKARRVHKALYLEHFCVYLVNNYKISKYLL